ncbi:MAG: LuxR C-terminal-related transcriptional regulator [Dysgonamonadaceae bacterium]|jgi:DNA-binding NarL/FixJ family response regulator|nr:LuxR C-terminal-related transcriptional regulator [Dysgonamonadaceae bacterium]
MTYPVKISLVEPSLIIRSGLLAVLHQLNTFQMDVYEIADIEQMKYALPRQKPDILVINPSALSLYPIQQIKKDAANPRMKCVALQNSLSDNALQKVYDEVISIYDTAEIIREKLTRLISGEDAENRSELLTNREKEIIVCVIKGLTNNQIADALHLSAHTVVSHRRNIAAKLQIHSAAGLTIYAIVNKLVEIGDLKDI